MIFNVEQIIISFGYTALFAIIFSETGLLLGFFLPGDTLLFSAGLLAGKGVVGLPEVIVVCFAAAVIGDSFGYYLGRRFGRGIFEKKEPHLLDDYLNKKNLEKAESLYEKYGDKIIFIARYIPVIRTIAPTLAGTAEMHYPTFLAYNVLGGLAWVLTGALAGYFIGSIIPGAMEIVSIIIILIVVLSLSPVIIKILKKKLIRQKQASL